MVIADTALRPVYTHSKHLAWIAEIATVLH
jgi:hypothetical protein